MSDPIRVMHVGHLAFIVKESLQLGQALRAANIEMPDGTRPAGGSFIKCGTCHQVFDWEKAYREAAWQDPTFSTPFVQ